jgi:LmbE family N-acetylglucosaminyl deacetylase
MVIIAPHIDDEVLGCASFLSENAVVVYVTMNHPLFPDRENVAERDKIADWIGFQVVQLQYETNRIEDTGYSALLSDIERLLDEHKPDTVLVPFPSYNQDHRIVHEAALTALRPHDRLHFVKRVLIYEEPDMPGTMRKVDFRPNYFRALDIDRKIKLYEAYRSQVRGHRLADHVRAISIYRGMQANLPNAEAFEVARWVQ